MGANRPKLSWLKITNICKASVCEGVLEGSGKKNLIFFLSVGNVKCYRRDRSCVLLGAESIIISEIRQWVSFCARSALC